MNQFDTKMTELADAIKAKNSLLPSKLSVQGMIDGVNGITLSGGGNSEDIFYMAARYNETTSTWDAFTVYWFPDGSIGITEPEKEHSDILDFPGLQQKYRLTQGDGISADSVWESPFDSNAYIKANGSYWECKHSNGSVIQFGAVGTSPLDTTSMPDDYTIEPIYGWKMADILAETNAGPGSVSEGMNVEGFIPQQNMIYNNNTTVLVHSLYGGNISNKTIVGADFGYITEDGSFQMITLDGNLPANYGDPISGIDVVTFATTHDEPVYDLITTEDFIDVNIIADSMLEGYQALDKSGNMVQGTIPTLQGQQIDITAISTTLGNFFFKDCTIVINDVNLIEDYIRANKTILDKTGTFTADATATAADILEGKTAGINGEMVTGTLVMPEGGGETAFYKCAAVHDGTVTTWDGYMAEWVLGVRTDPTDIIITCDEWGAESPAIFKMVDTAATGGDRKWKATIQSAEHTLQYSSNLTYSWAIFKNENPFVVSLSGATQNADISEICSGIWSDDQWATESKCTLTQGGGVIDTGTAGWSFSDELTTGLTAKGYTPEVDRIYSEDTTIDATLYPDVVGGGSSGGGTFYKCESVQAGDVTTWSGYKAVWDDGWTFASSLTTGLPVAAFWPTAGQIYTEDASMRVGNATVAADMDVMEQYADRKNVLLANQQKSGFTATTIPNNFVNIPNGSYGAIQLATGPDGNIYIFGSCESNAIQHLVRLNIATDTFEVAYTPTAAFNNVTSWGTVYSPVGGFYAYSTVNQFNNIFNYNPVTGQENIISISEMKAYTSGACVDAYGKIYIITANTKMVVLDPTDNSYRILTLGMSSGNAVTPFLAPNGYVYVACTYSDGGVYKINPETLEVTNIGTMADYGISNPYIYKWNLAADGKFYGARNTMTGVVFDPVTEAFSTFATSTTVAQDTPSIIGLDNCLYSIKSNELKRLKLDGSGNVESLGSYSSWFPKAYGYAGNGALYMFYSKTAQIIKIAPPSDAVLPSAKTMTGPWMR